MQFLKAYQNQLKIVLRKFSSTNFVVKSYEFENKIITFIWLKCNVYFPQRTNRISDYF